MPEATQLTGLSTNDLARAIGGKPASIRVRLCEKGSYYGLVPKRLPSGRLLWPGDSVERLLAAAEAKAHRRGSDDEVAG